MSKKPTAIERAVAKLDAKIVALQTARQELIELRSDQPTRKARTPKPQVVERVG